MTVLLFNSSPHENGCTYTALREIQKELEANGVDSEILQLGKEAVRGCTACGSCRKTGQCVFDDAVNRLSARLKEADGFVFGTPVYYAGISGQLKSLMDRLFYAHGADMRHKPAAAVVSARRGGCVTAFDDVNRYFTINSMPVVPSQYWNQIHGNTAQEALQDEEGLQTMRTLAKNMAWLLKCIQLGKENGVPTPTLEPKINTNFIR